MSRSFLLAARSITLTVPEPILAVNARPPSRDTATMCVPFWSVLMLGPIAPASASTTANDWLRSVVTISRLSSSHTIPCGPSLGVRSMVLSFAREAMSNRSTVFPP